MKTTVNVFAILAILVAIHPRANGADLKCEKFREQLDTVHVVVDGACGATETEAIDAAKAVWPGFIDGLVNADCDRLTCDATMKCKENETCSRYKTRDSFELTAVRCENTEDECKPPEAGKTNWECLMFTKGGFRCQCACTAQPQPTPTRKVPQSPSTGGGLKCSDLKLFFRERRVFDFSGICARNEKTAKKEARDKAREETIEKYKEDCKSLNCPAVDCSSNHECILITASEKFSTIDNGKATCNEVNTGACPGTKEFDCRVIGDAKHKCKCHCK